MNAVMSNLSRNAANLVARGLSLLPGQAPRRVIVELRGDYPLSAPPAPLGLPLPSGRQDTLGGLKRRLDRLADAPEIEGIVLLPAGFTGGLATAFNVRALIDAYRARGKQVLAFLPHVSNLTLLIASGADQVVALEAADLDARGLASRVNFMRGSLEKIGVTFEVERRAEYKAAASRLTHADFTAPEREQLEALLSDLQGQWVRAVAAGRSLSPQDVQAALDAGLVEPEQAVRAGLLDALGFEDELTRTAAPWTQAARFAPPRAGWSGPKGVAVVSLTGTMVPGESRQYPLPLPLFGPATAGSGTVTRAIRAAAADPNAGAIVLLVDSGGGAAVAGEILWREIRQARKRKPVVACFTNVAASGGYYVACAADRIVASPGTITGSIGVIYAKPDFGGLYEKLGMTPRTVKVAEHADLFSTDRPLAPEERERLARVVDRTYTLFKRRVADGRGLSLDEVEAVARGRVWSAAQALNAGLIDSLGTPFDAIDEARRLAGLPADAPAWPAHAPARYVPPVKSAAAAFAWIP
ncbi:MAG TPA: signal peptide peptidase SppA, partial [Deinococcales bacterium]|nr:signal peptide peptidase SppA [Deinococcales bacterium]